MVIVPVVLGLDANLVALEVLGMIMVMCILFKQLSLFLQVSDIGSKPIFRKVFVLVYFLMVCSFFMIWLVRIFEMLLLGNGYASPNPEAEICYSGQSGECTWVENMLFLINIVSGFISVNPFPPHIHAEQPGFLIYITGSSVLFLLGLLVNLTVIGYIISMMQSYFKEESERHSATSFLADVTALLGVDEFNRCLLLERFSKDAEHCFFVKQMEFEYRQYLIASMVDPEYLDFVDHNMVKPYQDWMDLQKIMLLRKTDLYHHFLPERFLLSLRKEISPFLHCEAAPEPVNQIKPSNFFKCKRFEKALAQLFTFALLDGSLATFSKTEFV